MLIKHSHYQYKVGAEVRLFKWVSLSASWNKVADNVYSRWNSYENFQVGVNLLVGARQESFSPTHSMAVTPRYPILARKEKDEGPKKVDVTIKYKRMYYSNCPAIHPGSGDKVYLEGHLRHWGYSIGYKFEKIGEDFFKIEAEDVDVNYPTGLEAYKIYVIDNIFPGSAERPGTYCRNRAYKIWLNGYLIPADEVYNQGTGKGEYILVKFDKNGVPHTYGPN